MISMSDRSTENIELATDSFNPIAVETGKLKLLSVQELNQLNQRSNLKGCLQLCGHLAIMAGSGYLWLTHLGQPWLSQPALVVYGFSFASMFAPMHECAHRTTFASNRLNDIVAWFAGLLSFYNSTFYRRYHKWHHRFTQIPGKDPELGDPKPTTLWEYGVEISGWNWWLGKLRTHFRIAAGHMEDYPYVPESARSEVIRSVRLQLLVYGVAIALSVALQQPWFLLGWLVPLMVGQPILRVILLSEHTGCTHEENPLTNTRTTLTLFPLRFLMWNMPFHAEHHLYASIPFHALPAAHEKLGSHFAYVESGYLNVNRGIITRFEQTSA
jgi:fatty acid desaturase